MESFLPLCVGPGGATPYIIYSIYVRRQKPGKGVLVVPHWGVRPAPPSGLLFGAFWFKRGMFLGQEYPTKISKTSCKKGYIFWDFLPNLGWYPAKGGPILANFWGYPTKRAPISVSYQNGVYFCQFWVVSTKRDLISAHFRGLSRQKGGVLVNFCPGKRGRNSGWCTHMVSINMRVAPPGAWACPERAKVSPSY